LLSSQKRGITRENSAWDNKFKFDLDFNSYI